MDKYHIQMIAQATLMILPEKSLCLWHERCNYTVKGLVAVKLILLPQITCETQEESEARTGHHSQSCEPFCERKILARILEIVQNNWG